MKRLIYGSLSVLTAISTAFLAAKAEVLSADNQPSASSEEISENTTAAGLDKAALLFGQPTATTALLDALSTASPLSTSPTQASNTAAGLVKTSLISVPTKGLLATTATSANAQAQSTPAAKPGSVQQSVPPASATESPKPIEGSAGGDTNLTAPGAAPVGVPGAAPETFIVPATPNNNLSPELAPEEEPASEADLAPAEDLTPAENLIPEADSPTPSSDLAPAENRAPGMQMSPEGQTSPSLSPMPNEGVIRESNPPLTPVTPGSNAPPAGVSPAGVPPAGIFPTGAPPAITPIDEAEPMTPLPPIPVNPSVVPSADPSVEPIEPLPPVGDSVAPDEFPVSGSSSDRLVGEGFTPFQLSYLALAGGLEDEGIPGGPQLISAYKQGDVSAEDIVTAGAMSNRLGAAASDQENYTQGVDRFLEIFRKDARSSS